VASLRTRQKASSVRDSPFLPRQHHAATGKATGLPTTGGRTTIATTTQVLP
jgi:hypothetical protein